MSTTARPRTRVPLLVALVASLGLLGAGAAPAFAADSPLPTVTGDSGWLRVAHLSPDTAEVTVQLSALAGGASVFELDGVAYGVVSDYVQVPVGSYVVAMTPSSAPAGAEPAISASVQVDKDKTVTIAAFGKNNDLKARVFQDDLTAPAGGASRIRLIQASTLTDTVSVQTTTGLLIASDARAGDSSSYATVPAGAWDLALTAPGVDDVASVTLADGTVNTLFVLDNAGGGLTVKAVLDSASVGAAPVGGVQTGGGGLASPLGELVPVGSY